MGPLVLYVVFISKVGPYNNYGRKTSCGSWLQLATDHGDSLGVDHGKVEYYLVVRRWNVWMHALDLGQCRLIAWIRKRIRLNYLGNGEALLKLIDVEH